MRWKNGLEWLVEPLASDLLNLIDETNRMVEAGIPQAESVCQQLEAMHKRLEWVKTFDREQIGLEQIRHSDGEEVAE